ncbi:MAG: hypothetical protein WBP48_09660, partial [Microbacterium sp.]
APARPHDGLVIDGLGSARVGDVGGGWLLFAGRSSRAESADVQLRFGPSRCEVTVGVGGAGWTHVLVGRRAAIMRSLVAHPEGMSAQELAVDVYGTVESEPAARAEVHRIRRELGDVVCTRPYRVAAHTLVDVTAEGDAEPHHPH